MDLNPNMTRVPVSDRQVEHKEGWLPCYQVFNQRTKTIQAKGRSGRGEVRTKEDGTLTMSSTLDSLSGNKVIVQGCIEGELKPGAGGSFSI